MATNQWLRSFYRSKEWTNFRMVLIQQRGPVCNRCKRIVADSLRLIGHHTIELTPENVLDFNISLNPDLVELICLDCHNAEHKRFGYENTGRSVFLVYGAPLSGKSTYVQQNKGHQDIVVDINLIFAGITMLPDYDKPDGLYPLAFQVQKQMIDHIKTRFGKWHNAWIVGGYADKYQRERIISETGADEIFMDVAKDECIARLYRDERLQFRKNEYESYIDKWFDTYQA